MMKSLKFEDDKSVGDESQIELTDNVLSVVLADHLWVVYFAYFGENIDINN